jgi:response regulator RpfG family c-di-GMP phosphodiesterase
MMTGRQSPARGGRLFSAGKGGGSMSDGLDVIIIDQDAASCESIAQIVNQFFTWGNVLVFSDVEEARFYCLNRELGIAIFILEVFQGEKTAFAFLDSIAPKYPAAAEDTIMITANASDDVVDMCILSDINQLLEKPVRPYALQFAVRSITSKYLNFAKRLREDPSFCRECEKFL